jgi:hypothetical protein
MFPQGTASEAEMVMGSAFLPGIQCNLFPLQAYNTRADTTPDPWRDWHKFRPLCTEWAQKN